ncbi:MAG: cytochrome c peroxidase [Pseudomonadota bacterium]
MRVIVPPNLLFRKTFIAAVVIMCTTSTLFGTFGNAQSQSTLDKPVPEIEALRAFWSPILRRPKARPSRTPGTPQSQRLSRLAALGERLFFDKRLSGDLTMSCSTCHIPDLGFTDGQPRRMGRRGQLLSHTVPSLWNVRDAKALTWSADVDTLEEHVDGPLASTDEMAGRWADVVNRLRADPSILAMLPRNMVLSPTVIRIALSEYQRQLTAPRTRFDNWIEGEVNALTNEEQTGFALFVGRASCVSCHNGWRFTDDRLHDLGLNGAPSPGQSLLKKTPQLRGITATAPYMHDGRFVSLAEVVTHYAATGLDVGLKNQARPTRREPLSADEQKLLLAFLKTL